MYVVFSAIQASALWQQRKPYSFIYLFISSLKDKLCTWISGENWVVLLVSTVAGRGADPSPGGPPTAAAGITDSRHSVTPQDPGQQRGQRGRWEAEGCPVQGPAHADTGARELVLLPSCLVTGWSVQPVSLGVRAWAVFQHEPRGEKVLLVSSQCGCGNAVCISSLLLFTSFTRTGQAPKSMGEILLMQLLRWNTIQSAAFGLRSKQLIRQQIVPSQN